MENAYYKEWFVIDFVNLNIESENEFVFFLNKWMPDYYSKRNENSLFLLKMLQEVEPNANAFDRELIPAITKKRKRFIKFQKEMQDFIIDFNKMADQNSKQPQPGYFKYIQIVSKEKIPKLNKKLSGIHYKIQDETLPNYTFAQVIVPNLVDFETCLYYNFIQYVNTHHSVLVCAACDNYISNPSPHQFANAKRGYATIHKNKQCQDEYRLRKDRERKRNKKGDNK
ncbi:hypothetical protein [Virgibacillus proomii]|uniref:hypothetical protein n=1 Tax=Virgibacillus proomii TaxID=84407 RepID=UPI00098711C3|nr:hypothetical protein [Virgibacillus proomii]